uniref:C2 calcium dependent domain containing 2 n=1 Tax=Neolamprologus brichardi TaxID=32507 RepID=A0A3Q4HPX4_NEOBR
MFFKVQAMVAVSESSSSYFGLEDPQWLCMVTLFIASLVTLILYFVQYFQHRLIGNKQGAAEGDNAATEEEEAAALLGWALSLKSWKSQWRRAWCIALNDEARKRKVSLMTTKPMLYCGAGDFNKSVAYNNRCHHGTGYRYPSLLVMLRSLNLCCRFTYVLTALVSPPKPPRAHEWKLLVKNIRVTLNQEEDAAGRINPLCVLQLDDPPQRFNTSVSKNTTSPAWDQPFIFSHVVPLAARVSVQLNQLFSVSESLLGQVLVPFDLVKKHPKGQRTFELITKDVVTGSLTTDFTYLEPSEVRSWQPPTPASNKRVEMDRTVMPCGTVVTTITAVKSNSPVSCLDAVVNKPKLGERRVSEQVSMLGGTVSKALSSSDTELLMLNGTDPVAEAAIRQLHQSAKQKLKSPVKKSTIIISGIAKTPLSQDDELAMMAGYAAAMDASMSESSSTQDVTTAIASGTSTPPEMLEPMEGPRVEGRPPDDWESQTGEEQDNASLSMCVSEASCKKTRGSFLQKSAKLFFRRRHQRKDPGMSQSHNDLVYLESPAAVERASRTATLSRMLNRKSKSKSKANGSTSVGEPHA